MGVIVRVDRRGRILIPKEIRRRAGIREGGFVEITLSEGKVILEPVESVASKYWGAFRVKKWPEDLDEFIEEVMREWWTSEGT